MFYVILMFYRNLTIRKHRLESLVIHYRNLYSIYIGKALLENTS